MRQRIATTHADNAIVPTIDAASLASMEKLGKKSKCDLLSHLIAIFLDDTPHVMRELLRGVTVGDPPTIRMMAHRLKGCSGNFGAHALMAVCAELEDLSSSGTVQGTAEVFQRVEREYQQVRRALEQVLAGRKRTPD